MNSTATGILLHSLKYNDSSIILKVFTKEYGIVACMAKGVGGKSKKNTKPRFQPLSILDMELFKKGSADIFQLKKSTPSFMLHGINGNMVKVSLSMFIVEVILKYFSEKEQNIELFNLLDETVKRLDKELDKNKLKTFHLSFLRSLLPLLGIEPLIPTNTDVKRVFCLKEGTMERLENAIKPLSSSDTGVMLQILGTKFDEMQSKQNRRKAVRLLLDYMDFQTDKNKVIKSLDIFEEIAA